MTEAEKINKSIEKLNKEMGWIISVLSFLTGVLTAEIVWLFFLNPLK